MDNMESEYCEPDQECFFIPKDQECFESYMHGYNTYNLVLPPSLIGDENKTDRWRMLILTASKSIKLLWIQE